MCGFGNPFRSHLPRREHWLNFLNAAEDPERVRHALLLLLLRELAEELGQQKGWRLQNLWSYQALASGQMADPVQELNQRR